MATASELLAMTANSGDDKTLIIDNDLRTIIIPESITNLGAEADKDVHRLNFQMPRYLGDTDLSELNIRINYMNANKEGDIYVVTDKKILSSTITFSWLVGAHALMYNGAVKFIVCLKESDTEGNVLREFNTTVATLPVLEGLEVDASYLGGELYDVLEQLQSLTESKVSEVESAGAEQITKVSAKSVEEQENIANKGIEVLATIPEDYTTTYKLANDAYRTKADAILCSAEGEVVAVTDSSDDCLRGLTIFGKSTQVTTTGAQIFDASRLVTATMVGVTLTNNGDGSFTISGDSTLTDTYAKYYQCTHDETLILLSAGSLKLKTEQITNPYVYAQVVVDGSVVGTVSNYKTAEEEIDVIQEWIDNESSFLRFGFFGKTEAGISDNVTIKPMVYQNGDGTWEPYTGGIPAPNPDYPQEITSVENPTATVHGKNLLRIDNTRTAAMLNGITITTTEGASEFVLGGTQTGERDASAAIVNKMAVYPGTYTFSVIGLTSGDYINLKKRDGDKAYVFTGASSTRSVTFTVNEVLNTYVELVTRATSNYSNQVVKIQLEAGSVATTYEPYIETQSIVVPYLLPAIPVTSDGNYTDSDGQQWICDEVDFERGVYVQRVYEKVFDGTEGWRVSQYQNDDTYTRYDYTASTYPAQLFSNCISEHYPYNGVSKNGMWVNSDQTKWAEFRIQWTYNTVDDLVAFLAEQYAAGTPVTCIYTLLTPIETPLTADEITAFQALRSNYPNTTVLNDSGATMKLKYNADLEIWLRRLIDERIAAAIDSIPADSTAIQAAEAYSF